MTTDTPLMVAVIEGFHPFDVPRFHALFRSLEGMDCYIQHVDNWAADWGQVRDRYDAVVFYNMNLETPAEGPVPEALAALGQTEQGVVILHHAILAYPDNPRWSELVGIEDRREFGYYPDQDIEVTVTDPAHPITQGLDCFTIHDESYTMNEAGEGSHVLLTADHPKSMKTIAWTRQCGAGRVFNLQLGHDARAWEHPAFKALLDRGIRWAAAVL